MLPNFRNPLNTSIQPSSPTKQSPMNRQNPSTVKTCNTEAKAWKDIWGSGQGIGAVSAIDSVADRVDKLAAEYNQARTELAAKTALVLA